MLRFCVHWRRLKSLLVQQGDGVGDIQSIVVYMKGKRHFTQLEPASFFRQIPITERDNLKRAFRDADRHLYEFNRAQFSQTVLPVADTMIIQ